MLEFATSILSAFSPGLAAPQDLTAGFAAPEGMRVELVAESPAVFNPTAIDIDDKGRIWVAEGVNYRKWGGRNPGHAHPLGDRIVVLEDRDGDGRAESSTVFAQHEELVSPLGILVLDDAVYVSCSPNIWRYVDRDGDLRADEREVFLTGFGGFDHDHGAHSLVAGPDGRLWMAVGNAGPHLVTDADGFTLRSGSSYTGGGPRSASNRPGLVSDDGRVWVGGLILSMDRDGGGLKVFAHNFRNQYEVAIDSRGRVFTVDNDDDGNAGCRVVAVQEGGNYGFFSEDGARTWQEDALPGQERFRAHWHADDPGVMPPGTRTGQGGPTGVCIYEVGALPERFAGVVLDCDAGAGVVYAHRPIDDEHGRVREFAQEDFLRSKSDQGERKRGWFRPSDVCVGVDGAIYVADWYDPGVGGHGAGDREAYGRILRVAPATASRSPRADLVARFQARGRVVLPLASSSKTNDAASELVAAARAHRAGDRLALEIFGVSARGQEEAVYAQLLAEVDVSPPSWPPAFAEVAWRLHPSSSLPAFLERALAPSLDLAERQRALSAIAFMDTETALEAMLAVAESGPKELLGHARAWLERNARSRWAGYGSSGRLTALSRDGARKVFDSGVLRDGAKELDVALAGAGKVFLVATDGGDGNGFDWVSFGDLRWVSPDGETAVKAAELLRTEVGWGSLGENRNAGGGPIVIDGRRFDRGLGVHAPAELVLAAPSGATHLRAVVGPDAGGKGQPGSSTSLTVEAWLETPPDRSAFLRARDVVLDESRPMPARTAAAHELVDDREGAALLVQLAMADRLPEAVKTAIGESMRRHPDLALRAMATRPFARPGSASAGLPPITELANRSGDPDAGREVFFGARAQCAACHVHGFAGNALGPELTRIGEKLDATGLLLAILEPSASIAFGYESIALTTVDGTSHLGFLLADGQQIVVKDLTGKRHVIARDQVATRTGNGQSLMPEGVALGMTEKELVDLVAFLARRPFDGLELGEPIALFDGRSLDGWVGHFPDGASTESVWSVVDGILHDRGRPIGYLRTKASYRDFVLVVEWRFPRQPGNGGVLLRLNGPDKVWPRSIEAQLQSGSAGDIWNIDEFGIEVARDRTNGRHTKGLQPSSERPLGEWNRYEIIVNGDALRLTVNGVVQNEAFGCEHVAGPIALQAEGAAMEFRRIELREIRR
ncbi:MAG: PVC-type heme-binding CxxCH protein [Planctomycetota bacterium]